MECYIPDACLGNTCREGYEGPLFDTCVINNNVSYFKQPQTGCSKCENALSSYCIMASVLIFFI